MLDDVLLRYPWMLLVFWGTTGLLVGSFCNVAIYRLPRYCLSIVRPGSHCPSCETPIAWFDNIPILAWALWLRGKCRHCSVKIHWRYPLVELMVGLWFLALAWLLMLEPFAENATRVPYDQLSQFLLLILWSGAGAALLVASWIDIEMLIIPDSISLGGALFVLLVAPLVPGLHAWGVPSELIRDPMLWAHEDWPEWGRAWFTTLLLMLIAAAALWCMGLFGYVLNYKEASKMGGGMGLGDVKVVMLLAGLLGWPKLVVAFVIAVLLGAIIGFPKLIKKWRGADVSSTIAFGPYLAAGTALTMLFSDVVFGWFQAYIDLLKGDGRF